MLDFREKKKSIQIKPPNNKINDTEDELEKGINDIAETVNEETEKIVDEIEKSDFYDLGESTETNYIGHLITFANAPLVKFIYFQVNLFIQFKIKSKKIKIKFLNKGCIFTLFNLIFLCNIMRFLSIISSK